MLRPAQDGDREAVLRWRNHPDVRAVSNTRHVITEDEHARWWARVTADPARRLLVYEREGVPSGVVHFFDHDAQQRSAWWGFFLDIAGLRERGELLPAWVGIERDAIRYAFGELGLERLEGEVFASNEAVRSMNRRHRFQETGSELREVDGEPVEVIHLELTSADVRVR